VPADASAPTARPWLTMATVPVAKSTCAKSRATVMRAYRAIGDSARALQWWFVFAGTEDEPAAPLGTGIRRERRWSLPAGIFESLPSFPCHVPEPAPVGRSVSWCPSRTQTTVFGHPKRPERGQVCQTQTGVIAGFRAGAANIATRRPGAVFFGREVRKSMLGVRRVSGFPTTSEQTTGIMVGSVVGLTRARLVSVDGHAGIAVGLVAAADLRLDERIRGSSGLPSKVGALRAGAGRIEQPTIGTAYSSQPTRTERRQAEDDHRQPAVDTTDRADRMGPHVNLTL